MAVRWSLRMSAASLRYTNDDCGRLVPPRDAPCFGSRPGIGPRQYRDGEAISAKCGRSWSDVASELSKSSKYWYPPVRYDPMSSSPSSHRKVPVRMNTCAIPRRWLVRLFTAIGSITVLVISTPHRRAGGPRPIPARSSSHQAMSSSSSAQLPTTTAASPRRPTGVRDMLCSHGRPANLGR